MTEKERGKERRVIKVFQRCKFSTVHQRRAINRSRQDYRKCEVDRGTPVMSGYATKIKRQE
ncbi:hypothetical protein ALC62_14853 [Cyphomyrmex costatus]|uniref:Uncharacterized protein n=1 Tax=Cyphomyrmex costatus TaxID=456900 RepID=A0A195C1B4_9HYME|nr:hypothetical protein ALC62_14853 [Cyphomyrmex costatus]